jgi:hypothetical protein
MSCKKQDWQIPPNLLTKILKKLFAKLARKNTLHNGTQALISDIKRP